MISKNIAIAVGSATLGALGVGYLTLGPSASADRVAIVDDSTDTAVAATDSTDTQDPPAPPTDAERAAKHQAHLEEILAPLVADQTLTQAQLDKVVETLLAAQPDRGPGPGGHGHGHGRGGPMGEDRGEILSLVATTIGITADEVKTGLQSGQTIAELATANNVDPQKVIDVLVLDATQRIDARVAAGDITAERATEIKTNLVERTTRFVNEGGPRHRGDQPPAGPEGDANADPGN